MKLEPWEPDLQTLALRIASGDLNLQPDFQRGIAWNPQKQQRLVDTVLRGWSIPAVHLIVEPDQTMSVLDGQQRLHSLKLFLDDDLPIRGTFHPLDPAVSAFHGFVFSGLPPEVQRRIQNYKVLAYRLYEFTAEEPHELFFRLNLPTGLTQAEKRNALVGTTHRQIKSVVDHAVTTLGWDKDLVGFSNARLAFDDSFARVAAFVEDRTLRQAATSALLENIYRRPDGLSDQTVEVVVASSERLTNALRAVSVRLNKATLVTWLTVAARYEMDADLRKLAPPFEVLLDAVETNRVAVRRGRPSDVVWGLNGDIAIRYLEVFNDRASSRVTDVLSVVARDAVAWRLASVLAPDLASHPSIAALLRTVDTAEQQQVNFVGHLLDLLEQEHVWGALP